MGIVADVVDRIGDVGNDEGQDSLTLTGGKRALKQRRAFALTGKTSSLCVVVGVKPRKGFESGRFVFVSTVHDVSYSSLERQRGRFREFRVRFHFVNAVLFT